MPKDDDATAEPPAPMSERATGPVPETIAGNLPENRGDDPGDTHRTPSGEAGRTLSAGEKRDRDVVAFLNRLIMIEEHAAHVLDDVRGGETDDVTRNRLSDIMAENRRAVEVLERTIRDMNGRVNPVRKTGGMIMARARTLFENIPQRARRAVESRDLNTMRETPPLEQALEYLDAYVGELTAAAHWDVLKEMADATGHRGLNDAVNECRDAAHAHADYVKGKLPQAARAAVERATAPTA